MNWWLSGRVSALHSVVAGSISSGGDHGICCWWNLIRLKQLSSISICHVQVFIGFSGCGNSIHNIIPLLKKKENVHVLIFCKPNLVHATIVFSEFPCNLTSPIRKTDVMKYSYPLFLTGLRILITKCSLIYNDRQERIQIYWMIFFYE